MIHLHCHTYNSLLDAAVSVEELVKMAAFNKMNAIAKTDHGSLNGYVDFWYTCKEHNIKPIIGLEAYICKNVNENNRSNNHIVLLAKNKAGFKNLVKINNISQEKFYYKPRIDFNILKEYSENIIVLSGCIKGEISQLLLNNKEKEAIEVAYNYKEIFKDNFYIEIQNHYLQDEIAVIQKLLKIARRLDIKCVATNDIHYLEQKDINIQKILYAIKSKNNKDKNDNKYEAKEHLYFKNEEEMLKAMEYNKELIDNTEEINSKIEEYDIIPQQDINNEYDLYKIINNIITTKQVNKERLEYEINIIKRLKFENYFSLIYDIINYCKNNNIKYSARGSVGGCYLAYLLDITNVNPIKYNLYFERFLNPNRVSPPDIDLDIELEKREQLIKYIENKYNNVYQVLNSITWKEKLAIKDALRISTDTSLAEKLKNNIRHFGVHASAVVISKTDLLIPTYNINNKIVLSTTMEELEKIKVLKIDLLGSATLSTINRCVSKYNISTINSNDYKSWRYIKNGITAGVFQLESQYAKSLLKKIKPNNLNELIAFQALCRPSSAPYINEYIKRKINKFDNNEINNILNETYSVPLYQEQIMNLANKVGGLSLAEADILRKAISKKDLELIKSFKEKIYCNNNIDIKTKNQIWNMIELFAGYGFNKAHATLYAIRSFLTCFLKANYPDFFLESYINTHNNDEKTIELIKEYIKIFNYNIILDINYIEPETKVKDKKIIIGFNLIKNIIYKDIELIIKNRPYYSIQEFVNKIGYNIDKKTISSLIYAGAFDNFKDCIPLYCVANTIDNIKKYLQSSFITECLIPKTIINNRKKEKEILGFNKKSPKIILLNGPKPLKTISDGNIFYYDGSKIFVVGKEKKVNLFKYLKEYKNVLIL